MSRIHVLKTWPAEWQAVRDGRKPFELRKNDRVGGFNVGDALLLVRFDPETQDALPNDVDEVLQLSILRIVSHVTDWPVSLREEHVALGLEYSAPRSAHGWPLFIRTAVAAHLGIE